jgi:hypothetical protein
MHTKYWNFGGFKIVGCATKKKKALNKLLIDWAHVMAILIPNCITQNADVQFVLKISRAGCKINFVGT